MKTTNEKIKNIFQTDTQTIECINDEKKNKLKQKKQDWWKNKGKKYNRFTLTLDAETNEKLELQSKLLGKRPSQLAKELLKQSLTETNDELIESNQLKQIRQKNIQETLQIFRGIANNINQIARGINEKRLTNPFKYYITGSEKKQILDTIENLENKFCSFITSNHKQ